MAVEPSETLTFAATWGTGHTLGGSPDLLMPRGFQSCLYVLTPGLPEESFPIQTSHRATWHPYLRNGPHGEGPICQQHPLGPRLRKPSSALIFPY